MGSSRLPGKVMLPLGNKFEIEHIFERIANVNEIDEIVLATSKRDADDILGWIGEQVGVPVFRGVENNVLERVFNAADDTNADEIIRITADCPLIDPQVVDVVLSERRKQSSDYASNVLERTFPRGLDVEVFTFDSFRRVHDLASTPAHLEHVTQYYTENPSEFKLVNVASDEVFCDDYLLNRTDLRLTLDELDDYRLLRTVFNNLEYSSTPPFSDAVRYIDEHDLSKLNDSVAQKSPKHASNN
jgi:spore coat polysaccharide biosynthesis protein SpsF